MNFCAMTCPDEAADAPLEAYEREALERSDKFVKFGTAYVMEHATRTATIGFVLSSSPLALLAWYSHPFILTVTDALLISWAGLARSSSRGRTKPRPRTRYSPQSRCTGSPRPSLAGSTRIDRSVISQHGRVFSVADP